MSYKFYIEKDKALKVELRHTEDTVDLYIDGECVAYFDDDGLNLLTDCTHLPNDLLDSWGQLKIHKAIT